MESEIVLFLQDRVPEAALLAALGEAFGISPDTGDPPLLVDYAQGFAIGISIPGNGDLDMHRAARMLSDRITTSVLMEDDAHWLLFAPGAPQPIVVQVVELRHGLDVTGPAGTMVRAVRAATV